MKILKFRTNETEEIIDINNDLEAFKNEVNGTFQSIFLSENVILICNEFGKVIPLCPNRMVCDFNGAAIDIIYGDFFICEFSNDTYNDLSEHNIYRSKLCTYIL